ncbi:MAG TPA: FAD-binding oxidoreductase [Acidimicrobiales bacterium]|nr:FAD-binding oxidoreductase [Acidimicrobiales bacterium]
MTPFDGPDAGLTASLIDVLGREHVLTDPEVMASFTTDWTGRWPGRAALVVRPGSTDGVVEVVQTCAAAGVAMVPQGGNTGLVGGSVPSVDAGRDGAAAPVVVSLLRLRRLEPIDEAAAQVTVGAGTTLATLQRHVAASANGLAFGVDLGARDSATIGGMVATNAGGIHFVRHGGMRQQVVGIEAVLADGRRIERMAGLAKDNSGYDLAGLFTGSEGTLGIVTAVRLRLVPALAHRVTAMLGLAGTEAAVDVTAALGRSAAGLEAAEIFYQEGLDLVCRHGGLVPPLLGSYGAYLLVECAGTDDSVVTALARCLSSAGVGDEACVVATEAARRQRLWMLRERHPEAVNSLGVPHKLDVSLPLAKLPAFEEAVRDAVDAVAPGAAVIVWGHVGDGNLHVNVVGPPPEDDNVDGAVYRLVAAMGGSISAEHGIGRAKRKWLSLTRSAADIDAMRAIKAALDPANLFNPGVLLPPAVH